MVVGGLVGARVGRLVAAGSPNTAVGENEPGNCHNVQRRCNRVNVLSVMLSAILVSYMVFSQPNSRYVDSTLHISLIKDLTQE